MFRKKDSGIPRFSEEKILVCASETATISIGIHVLILFAGSIVAIKIVQKGDASFEGEKIDRPKLERGFQYRRTERPTGVASPGCYSCRSGRACSNRI